MSIDSIIATTLSIISIALTMTVLLKTARRNELDGLGGRLDKQDIIITKHTAKNAVLCQRCNNLEKTVDEIKGELRGLRK